MLNRFARALFTRLFTPFARLLISLGVSPDVVTLVGTLGVCAGALIFFPRGQLFAGVMVITVFVFSDTVDGIMARLLGRSSKWGAFLDSSLDRFGDAAVFGGLVLYYNNDHYDGPGGSELGVVLALACLCLGSIVSYVRARAEGIGLKADVGIAERADRLVATLLAAGFCGVGWLPDVCLIVVLAVLAVASAVTLVQRILYVRSQVIALSAATPAAAPASAPVTPAPSTAASPAPDA